MARPLPNVLASPVLLPDLNLLPALLLQWLPNGYPSWKTKKMPDLQSRFVNIKCNMSRTGLAPEDVVAWIRHEKGEEKDEFGDDFGGWTDAECFWAVHEEEKKELHFHMVVRFKSVTRWGRLRTWLKRKDEHHYSQPARAFNRSVRYLLHLDNPEKCPIPRENFHVTPNVDESEVSMILGAPRTCVLHDIRNMPQTETFRAFDFLVNERGHSPNEVAQVLRCLSTINDWIKQLQKDELLRAECASVPGYFLGEDDDPFRSSSNDWDDPDFAPDCE